MKSTLKLILMIIISISTKANNPFMTNSRPTGSGLFSKSLQDLTDAQEIADKSYEAFIAMANNDKDVLRTHYKSFRSFDTKTKMREHIESRLGFTKGSFTDANMLKVFQTMECIIVGTNFWEQYESGYVVPGVSEFKWWDPRRSTVYRNRTKWVVWFVTVNGVQVYLFVGNCGNPIKIKEKTDLTEQVPTTEFDDFNEEYETDQAPPKKKRLFDEDRSITNTSTATNTNTTTVNVPAAQVDNSEKSNKSGVAAFFGSLIGGAAGAYLGTRAAQPRRIIQQTYSEPIVYETPRPRGGYHHEPPHYQYSELNPPQSNNPRGGGHTGQYNNNQLNNEVAGNYGGRLDPVQENRPLNGGRIRVQTPPKKVLAYSVNNQNPSQLIF